MGNVLQTIVILLVIEMVRLSVRVESLRHEVHTVQEDVRRLWRRETVKDEIRDSVNTTINTGGGSIAAQDSLAGGASSAVAKGIEGSIYQEPYY